MIGLVNDTIKMIVFFSKKKLTTNLLLTILIGTIDLNSQIH